MTFSTGLVIGLALWTLLEYLLHRFAFHRRIFGNAVAREHIQHHAAVDYFASPQAKALLAIPVLGTIVGVSVLALGVELGVSVPLGTVAGWIVYEIIHRRIHTSAPVGPYGRWARRHHLLHHFGRADRNHGVTTPIWDHVFGTIAPRETVKVPRRHARKFPWLLDGDLEAARIAAAFEAEYRIV
jgi:sterol desaturase/sphingolipid hydroxylase (fatty acid hydroxylase superfamily)